jgi:hypothetical protein
MKRHIEIFLLLLLIGLLSAIYFYLGHRVALMAGILSGIWFVITVVLLSRPPGIPEFVSDEVGSDEQHVVRKDVIPKLPWQERIRLALSVACGSSLLLWLSLAVLAK